MDRLALLLTVIAVFGKPSTAWAQDQLSRAAFFAAVKSAAQTAAWNDLIEIPQLAAVTDGRKAGYVLAIAYLAAQELGIPVTRADESKNYLVLKADGLFTAQGYDPNNPTHMAAKRAVESMGMKARTQITFAPGFQLAADRMMNDARSGGGCAFLSGWSGNDARQVEFLQRTCIDLRNVLSPMSAQARTDQASVASPAASTKASRASPSTLSSPTSPRRPRAGMRIGDSSAEEFRAEAESARQRAKSSGGGGDAGVNQAEINRRSQLSLEDLRAGMTKLRLKERRIVSALERNTDAKRTVTNPKLNAASRQSTQAELANEREGLEALLAEVRADIAMQAAALAPKEAREREIEGAKRRAEMAEQARKDAARDAVRDRFEESSYGRRLKSVIHAALLRQFLQDHPSPLPTERAAGERAVNTRARCIVRYITPRDPDNMTADDRAAIEMIIRDLPTGTITNRSVAMTYSLMNGQCMTEGQ